jgi:hypothetical protein
MALRHVLVAVEPPKWSYHEAGPYQGDHVATIGGLVCRVFEDVFGQWTMTVEGDHRVFHPYTNTILMAKSEVEFIAQANAQGYRVVRDRNGLLRAVPTLRH